MTTTNGNIPLINRKSWQMMTSTDVATTAGSFVVSPQSGNFNIAMFVSSATVQFLYHHDEDAFVPIASGALSGVFGAGSCGEYHPWSITYTANGGSSNTVTVASATHNLIGVAKGSIIEFISSGTNSGLRRTVTDINTSGAGTGNITLTLDSAVNTAVLNTHTFRLNTGRFYILNAYAALASGVFKVFDVATLTWQASLGNTNLPASWGTDGRLVCAYNYNEIQGSGTATSGGASTLTNTAKAWIVNQWTNYQVRITSGTGIGQVRTIASNTATVLTTSVAWTTTPDSTSVYVIEANEDYIYALGNNAVTMYRYSISANTWTVMAPTTARAGAPIAGMGAVAIGKSGESAWADETNIQDGRYIYSPRGGGVASIDRFDIAGGTAGAGAWQAITYPGAETFATGSSYFVMGRYIFIRKDATNKFYKYSVRGNYIEPLSKNLFPDGTALLGNKIWVKNFVENGTTPISWVYALRNSGTELHRMMLI